MEKLNVAIVGAGALTQKVYMPILKEIDFINVNTIVDVNKNAVQQIANIYNVPNCLEDYCQIEGVDAVIIVLPNFLHAKVAIDLLKKGLHVLIEKPMAITIDECDQMIENAKSANRILQIGHVRRFYDNVKWVKSAIESNAFGKLMKFEIEEGFEFDWPIQSDALLRRDRTGGGVLIDTGSHVIDALVYWLEDLKVNQYFDDAFDGGVEAECELQLTAPNDIQGIIKLSRLRTLSNNYKLYFENCTLVLGLNANSEISIIVNGKSISSQVDNKRQNTKEAFKLQILSFYNSIVNGNVIAVSGEMGRKTVELIQNCYTCRQLLQNSIF